LKPETFELQPHIMLVSLFFLQAEEEGGRFETEALKTTNKF
jgi:hypothetical protein